MTQRKDGRWQKAVTINGKRIFFYSSADTERKAQKDIEQQLLDYTEKKENGATFEEVANAWYAQATKRESLGRLSSTTTHRYNSLRNRCVEYFGDYYIKNIKTKDIDRFLETLVEKDFSSKSIKDHLSVIHLIFKHAFAFYDLETDVSLYATLPKGKPSVARNSLTESEQNIVKNSVDAPFGLFAYTLLYTGLRRGEAIALQWSDIDFEKKTITINRNAVFATDKVTVKEPKTSAGIRTIILLDCLAEKLLPLMPSDRSQFVFSGDVIKGNSWYTRRWKDYQKATQLDVTPHQLRHTFATILYEAGIDIKDAQNLMGHSDITTTQNIYTHIRESRITETAQKLNGYLQ